MAETIRRERAGRGWSQSVLAERADVSRPTVARVESGQEISATRLSRIAAALGLRLALVPMSPDAGGFAETRQIRNTDAGD